MDFVVFLIIIALVVIFAIGMSLLDNEEGSGVTIVICSIIVFVLGLLLIVMMSEEIYKEGQVDALTGKIKYELIENTDKTKKWEKIGE